MKKIILTVLVLVFTTLSANASYMVHFNNTGRPVSYSRGIRPAASFNNYGRNASFSPGYRRVGPRHYARPHRMANQHRQYANCPNRYNSYARRGTAISSYTPQTSRFSKNYTVPVTKSYSRGGMTYYN